MDKDPKSRDSECIHEVMFPMQVPLLYELLPFVSLVNAEPIYPEVLHSERPGDFNRI